jgi:hypothetical protein
MNNAITPGHIYLAPASCFLNSAVRGAFLWGEYGFGGKEKRGRYPHPTGTNL